MSREFDLVVWGPTGFTGRLCVNYLAEVYGPPRPTNGLTSSPQDGRGGLHYALAGRNRERLQEVANLMKKKFTTEEKAVEIPLLVVNASDEEAVADMCRRTRCVVALAGPYASMGEVVVKGCAENGTHYVDLTGELAWVAAMQSKYNDKAKQTKAKIIHGVGFGYVPNDLSMAFLQKMCESRNLKIEKVQQYEDVDDAGFSGGTIRSLLNGLASISFGQLREYGNSPYCICTYQPTDPAILKANQDQSFISYSSYLKRWTHPSVMRLEQSRYVRWSNEVQGFPWGKDLVFGISAVGSSFFGSLFASFMIHFAVLFLFVLSRLPFLHGFIASPSGTAGFDANKSEGRKVEFTTVAQCVDQKSRSTKTIACNFLMKNAEIYKYTGVSCIESAIGTLFAPPELCPRNSGVMSATAALGMYLKERMEKHGLCLTLCTSE